MPIVIITAWEEMFSQREILPQPTPCLLTLSVPTEQSGVGQGGDDHSAYSSILAQRIAASSPTYYGGAPVTTDLGCNGWTNADLGV